MRFLILSDIHGNIDALDAVLARSPPESYDRLLVLGDLVGYCANPNEVVERIFQLEPDVVIRGNHDKFSTGVAEPDDFRRVSAEAARWTHRALTPDNRAGGGAAGGPKRVTAIEGGTARCRRGH